MNGSEEVARSSKRKAAGSPDQVPQPKRSVNGKHTEDGDAEFAQDEMVLEDTEMEPPLMYIGTPGSLGEWGDTIQNVVRNVVAIRFSQTCSFDTDPAMSTEASGFVVDAERG